MVIKSTQGSQRHLNGVKIFAIYL